MIQYTKPATNNEVHFLQQISYKELQFLNSQHTSIIIHIWEAAWNIQSSYKLDTCILNRAKKFMQIKEQFAVLLNKAFLYKLEWQTMWTNITYCKIFFSKYIKLYSRPCAANSTYSFITPTEVSDEPSHSDNTILQIAMH